MRGTDKFRGSLLSYVDIEDRIPAWHPLRRVKRSVDDALVSLTPTHGSVPARRPAPPACSVSVSLDSDGNKARSSGGATSHINGKARTFSTEPKSARLVVSPGVV